MARLPANLEGSRLAEKLQAIAKLDLDELQMIDLPRGYGSFASAMELQPRARQVGSEGPLPDWETPNEIYDHSAA